jgi:hypothetical protein
MCLSDRAIFMLFLFSFVRLPRSEPGLPRSPPKSAASVPISLSYPYPSSDSDIGSCFLPGSCRDDIPRAKGETRARLRKSAWSRSEREFVRDYIVGQDHAGIPGSDGASPEPHPTRAGSLRQLKFLESPMQGTPADPQFFRRLGAVASAFVQGSHDQADFVVVDVDEILGSHFAERKTA